MTAPLQNFILANFRPLICFLYTRCKLTPGFFFVPLSRLIGAQKFKSRNLVVTHTHTHKDTQKRWKTDELSNQAFVRRCLIAINRLLFFPLLNVSQRAPYRCYTVCLFVVEVALTIRQIRPLA